MTGMRRRLDDAGTMGYVVVVASAALLAVASVVVTASPDGFVDLHIAIAFGAFIAVGELVRITLPGGRDAAPIATAGALGYVLLTRYPDGAAHHSALQVVAVVVVAMLVGVAPHAVVGRAPSVDSMARRVLSVGVAAAIYRGSGLDAEVNTLQDAPLAFIMIGVVLVTLVVDAVVAAAVRAGADRAPFVAVLRNEIRAQAGIGSAIGATGALLALAASIMGSWALPVFVVPLLLTQFSFRRYAAIRESSLQTIRALSRVTELGGYTESGHSRRVSQMAVAVGRELGMSDAELRDLEYAALMHDIGQLSLAEPIPGGATVVAAPAEQRRIAHLGADVIRQTGVLDGVASIVAQQAEPYRRAHDVRRRDIPLASPDHQGGQRLRRPGRRVLRDPPPARRARAAAAGHGLRVRPDRRRVAVQDRRAFSAPRRLSASRSGGQQEQTDARRDEHVTRADHLWPARQRHRDHVAERAEPGGRPGRLPHRVPGQPQLGPRDAGPGGGVDRDRHRRVGADHQDVEQQTERHQRYAGQPRVPDQEQPDEHHRQHQGSCPGETGPGHQCRRTELDDRGGDEQPDGADAHLGQPGPAGGRGHGYRRDRDHEHEHHAR